MHHKAFLRTLNVTLDHKTSHTGTFLEIEIYTSEMFGRDTTI